jgi:hypothetical protein
MTFLLNFTKILHWFHVSIAYVQNFSKNLLATLKFEALESDMEQVPYQGPKNIWSHCQKFIRYRDVVPASYAFVSYGSNSCGTDIRLFLRQLTDEVRTSSFITLNFYVVNNNLCSLLIKSTFSNYSNFTEDFVPFSFIHTNVAECHSAASRNQSCYAFVHTRT